MTRQAIPFSFGTLDVSGTDVSITASQGLTLEDVSADNFTLAAAGDITSAGSATLTVSNAAEFDANGGAGNIDLLSSSNAFGTLALTGATVGVAERDAMTLDSVAATDFQALVGGEVTDIGTITVTGQLDVDSGTRSILLDSVANSFGTIDVSGGVVEISEADATQLGVIEADEFTLDTDGAVTQTAGSILSIADVFTIDASTGNDITLNESSNNFGSMDLTGRDIEITEAQRFSPGTGNGQDVCAGIGWCYYAESGWRSDSFRSRVVYEPEQYFSGR
ncbi:MAG: hypothetical protein U5O39_19050 [Gammaproteobacteria bacterium]|nr:hypothetical protein [Gammaproteobacteria bacterium]